MSAERISQPDNPIGTLRIKRSFGIAREQKRGLITFDNSIDPEPESRPFTVAQAMDVAKRAQGRAIHAELQLQAAQKEIAELKATVASQDWLLAGHTDFELQSFSGGR